MGGSSHLHCSANANKELKRKLESAERILKLGELCRKLETEQEKVLPFCTPEQALGLHPPADQQDSRHLEADASATGLEDTDHQVGIPAAIPPKAVWGCCSWFSWRCM